MLRTFSRRFALGALPILSALTYMRVSAQGRERPYFMPPTDRNRLQNSILDETWAKADYARLKKSSSTGGGFASAFLYALEGDLRHAAIAQQWLLGKYGKKAYWSVRAAERLNSDFFKGGQIGIPEIYYDVDISGYLAFDWTYKGLETAARKEIEEGIVLWSHYKMRAMDRWTQTANLVFKPTATVALAGLATDNSELISWGFQRTKPWGARLGGYDVVLDTMLIDGGPWHEAAIYPVAQDVLLMIARLSYWRGLYDQKDWFGAHYSHGGSGKGLMDYYIDTAYPIERTGHGPGQIRVASYGDGSTNSVGDLILVNPAAPKGNVVTHEALIAAYNASRDTRYGAFIAMIPGYKPNLIDQPPPPAEKDELPPAPSKVWPNYGLAMLRSDESPNYWTSGKAISVFHIMSKGYGHAHADKFSIILHGAGRLIYPDYNALQYENPSVGWTRNSVSHNLLIVDEGETRDAELTALRHEFSPEVKFLASSANGVFEGVDQTRALLLMKEYLLDLVYATSPVPHTYDYVLHSFGRVAPEKPDAFTPTQALMKRYWLVDDQKAMMTSEPWMLDFIIEERPGTRDGFGQEWYLHKAKLRLRMAGEPDTLVMHGVWGNELARLVSDKYQGATLDQLSAIVARRSGQREALFVASHEPYANSDQPQITSVVTLARKKGTAVIRVEANSFTDYAAVAFGPQPEDAEHSLFVPGEQNLFFAFKNYGYARITKDGSAILRGNWTGLRLPGVSGPVSLSGAAVVRTAIPEAIFLLGRSPIVPESRTEEHLPELPMTVKVTPAPVRLAAGDRRSVAFTLSNTLDEPVSGALHFQLPRGLAVEPEKLMFGPVQPGMSTGVQLTILSNGQASGSHTVPYQVSYRRGNDSHEIHTAALPLTVVTGPTLRSVYEYPRPYYLIQSPLFSARADMLNGLHRFLADDDGTPRLNGNPLFTLSDGSTELLSGMTGEDFTWPIESPASLTANLQDRARWQAIYFNDRILFRMDSGWTQFQKTYFSLPGNWLSPQGTRWRRIVAIDNSNNEVDAQPGPKVRAVAAELEFPEAKWNLAFKFEPVQEVTFNGSELAFAIGSLTNDNWQVGFCRPGALESWRGK
jgi:Heparinase II/III-like protein